MQNYLLLNDGSFFCGELINQSKNILGKMILNNEGNIVIKCQLTGKEKLIVNKKDNQTGYLTLSNVDFQGLKQKIKENKTLLGKIVTDSLPIEYHVYDLKTYIPANIA
ncbi:hypothetical protein [Thermohalobacter berrensis]|uniref:Uncharacterized protein n=1 Tax=Thermohalobacter berrensis TaxID=99594 RepID=A0A419T7V4_9FIRM|nr:hypothetical protein [Thermohalobacter berrensis]RKD33446.1 hypothetical protein BET03_09345 [Thermohalobacter berrensis]